jgi:hypothetical protein
VADLEHLKLIQAVITRLAGNSFLIKGWSVTIVAGLSAIAKAQNEAGVAWIAAGVVVVFAVLDAFYLALERAYRDLYQRVAADSPGIGPWTLKVQVGGREVLRGFNSLAVSLLHGAVFAGALIVALSSYLG